MVIRFLFQLGGLVLLYSIVMLAALPFLVYFGKPKPWQRAAEFLMSFPFDNEKLGLFSFKGAAVIVLLNGLLWGIVVIGVARCFQLVISLVIK